MSFADAKVVQFYPNLQVFRQYWATYLINYTEKEIFKSKLAFENTAQKKNNFSHDNPGIYVLSCLLLVLSL